MKLFKLSFSIFCGAKWGKKDIQVMGISKEQCLETALDECSAIDLQKSCSWNKTVTASDYENIVRPPNQFVWNRDYEVFKRNPEKYIDFDWEEIELPYVIVN